MVAASAIFRGMEGKDSIPVLEQVEGLNGMPVVKMQDIKLFSGIMFPEILYHPFAHAGAVFHDICAFGLAVMVVNMTDRPIGNPANG